MKPLSEIVDLFGNSRFQNSKKTERGELMREFIEHLNPARAEKGYSLLDMPRMGRILQGIPTKDLYFLKSVCEKAPNYSARFWWELDIENHGQSGKVLTTYPKQ